MTITKRTQISESTHIYYQLVESHKLLTKNTLSKVIGIFFQIQWEIYN